MPPKKKPVTGVAALIGKKVIIFDRYGDLWDNEDTFTLSSVEPDWITAKSEKLDGRLIHISSAMLGALTEKYEKELECTQ